MAWTWHRTQVAGEGHRAAAAMPPLVGAGRGLTAASSSPILPCLQTARPKGCISASAGPDSLCTAGGCCSQGPEPRGLGKASSSVSGAGRCDVEMQWARGCLSLALSRLAPEAVGRL